MVDSRKGYSPIVEVMAAHARHSCRLIAAGSNVTATLPLLSGYLLDAAANYSDTRPCMLALLARLQHINSTVIVLPASLGVSSSLGWQNFAAVSLVTCGRHMMSFLVSQCERPGGQGKR